MDPYRWQKRPTPGQDANVNPQQPPPNQPPPPTSTTLRSSNPNPLPTTAAPPFLSQPLMPSQGFPPSYPRSQFHTLANSSHSTPIVRDTLVPPPPHPSHHPHHSYSPVQPQPPLHVPLQPNRLPQLPQLQSQLQQPQPRLPHLSHPTQLQQPPPTQSQQQNNQQPTSLSIHSSRRLSSSSLHQSTDPRSQQMNRSDTQPINLSSASRLPHLQSQPNPINTSPQQQPQTSSQQQQVVQKQPGQKSPPQTSSQQPNNPSQQQPSSQSQQQQTTQTTNNTSAVVQTNNQQQDPNQQSSSAQQNQQHTQSQQLPSHSQPSPQHQQQHLSLPHPARQSSQQSMQQSSQPHQMQRQAPPYHQQHEQDPRMNQHSHRDMKRSIYESQQPPYRLSQPQQPSYYHPYSTSHPHPHPHQPQMSAQHPQMYVTPIISSPHEYQQHNVPHETHDPQMQQQHQRLAPNHSMIPQHPQHPQHAPPPPHHHQQPQPQQPPQQPQQMVHHTQQPQPPPPPPPPPQQMNPQQRPQQQSSQPQAPQQTAQQQQQRQGHKMITPLQPQPMSMVQMRQPQNQQQSHSHLQQQQQIANPEHHHHLQKQQMQAVSSQQPLHMGHHQQSQQPLSTGSNRLQPIQERRPNSVEIHQPPAAQMHMPPPPPPPPAAVMSSMPLQQRPPMAIRQLPQQPPVAKQQPQQQPLPPNQQHMHSQQSHQPTHTQVIPAEQSRHQHPVQQAQPQTQENMSRSQPIQPMQNMQIDTSNTNAAQSSTTMNQEGNANQQQQGGAFRQLRVEDALAYLEQVKSRFSESPSVYNNFLDIMKEFKAQTIDTSEVIRRVSSLFQGHRELILGFNTFLPPGYRIELRGDPVTGGVTGFSTPGGVFCPLREANQPQIIQQSPSEMNIPPSQQQPVPVESVTPHPSAVQSSQTPRHQMHHGQPEMMHQPMQQTEVTYEQNGYVKQPIESEEKPAMIMNMNQGQHQMNVTTSQQPMQTTQPAQPTAAVSPSPQNDNAAAALAGGFGSSACTTTVASGNPIEFGQAVTYVNRIKSRFSEDEQGYKTFLDILQTYQREQRSIKDVYKQVSELFKDHDDLLQEFSHFLPEQVPKAVNAQTNKRKDSDGGGNSRSKPAVQVKQQPTLEATPQDTSSTPSNVNKPRDKTSKGTMKQKTQRSGQSSLGPSGGITKTNNSNQRKNMNGKDKTVKKSNQSGKKSGTDSKSSPALQSVATPSTIAGDAPGPELEFFEELRMLLGEDGRQNYSEFIKCLSLFSAEIICLDELLRLADGLLNHRKPLTDAFRAFLDQADPNATQSAVNVLKKNKSSNGTGNQSKSQSIQRNLDSPSARERLRDIPAMVGLEASRSGGNKSPRVNPLYKNKPLSEIGRDYGSDLPDSKTYKAVPADLGTIQCSGMSENDRSVLNHLCISKGNTNGKKLLDDDSSNKNDAQKSISAKISTGKSSIMNETGENWEYEPRGSNNITIEDQRVELDLLIARAQSCIEKLERLEKGETRSASSLNQVDLKPIELIYREASVDMIDALKSNPSGTVPIILERLRQRLKDWKGSRSNMTKIWKSNQFSSANQEECTPRSWQKSELISELILLRKEKEVPSSLNWLVSRKKISGHDIRGMIVCEDDNLGVICDILWYAFEWEAQSAEEADEGLAFLERVYYVMQRSEQKRMSILADDYLYWYIRLLAEASERIEYLVREDKVEMCTDETIQKIKDVLGNFVTLEKYDDHCKKVYKNVDGWEDMLGELPLILKRLGELALKMPKREVAEELLSQAEKGVRSESNVETSHEDDTMTDIDEGKNGDGSSEDLDGDDVKTKYSKRLRQAIVLTKDHDCHLFEIKVHEDMKHEEKNGKRKRYLDVSFRFIPREIANQFKKLNIKEDYDDKKDEIKRKRKKDIEDTAFTKYVRRAKKRSRSYFHGRTGQSLEGNILRADELNTRVDDSNGQRIYVAGTADFFMRKGFGRAKRKIDKVTTSSSK